MSVAFARAVGGFFVQAQSAAPDAPLPLYLQKSEPVAQRINDLVNRMSLAEKAGQLQVIPMQSESRSGNSPGAGGVVLASHDQDAIAKATTYSRLGIPPLVLSNELAREGQSALDRIGATWSQEAAQQAGALFAARQQPFGVNAIVLPLDRFLPVEPHAADGGEEVESGWLMGALGRAYEEGVRAVAPDTVVFPADFPVASREGGKQQVGARGIRMSLARPFEPLLRDGKTLGVLLSPGEIDGIPTVTDASLLHNLLRTEWNFGGITLAAPGSVDAVADSEHAAATSSEAICQAINAGVDMQWSDSNPRAFAWSVEDCVRNGVITMARLDQALGDVLRVKFELGMLDGVQPAAAVPMAGSAAQIAAQSLVLLRNQHHLLPLSQSVKSILVIDRGAKADKTSGTPRLAEELRKLLPTTTITESDGKDATAGAAAAKSAKVVVLEFADAAANEEAAAKDNTEDADLLRGVLEANEHVIAVFDGIRSPALPWSAGHVPAIVEAWSSGNASEVASALVGNADLGGRMPVAIRAPEPDSASDAGTKRASVLFPLGFGMSYTTFHYSDLTVRTPDPGSKDDVQVRVTISNTGKVAGDEVAQLYLHHEVSSVATANRALVGFERVHLQPAETRTLTFTVKQHQLAVWNADGRWVVEPGPYTIFAGGDSEAELKARFTMGEPDWVGTLESNTDRWIAAPSLEVQGNPPAEFAEAYQLALRVMEYNLRDGLLEAGKGYGTWTRDTSINAWNAASLLIPEVARRTLWHETEPTADGPLVGGQYWDKVIWIIAARNYVAITGDRRFLASAYRVARRTLTAMRAVQFDAGTGLFRGPAVYGDGVAAYPDPPFNDKHGDNVLDYTQGAELETLSTNSVYYGAYRNAAEMGHLVGAPEDEIEGLEADAAGLRNAIEQKLWLEKDKRFGYFLDANGSVDSTQEALGEALAVSLGVASVHQAHLIFDHAAVTPWGVPCTWQPFRRYVDPQHKVFGRHNGTIWPFINAFWATAAASVGESGVFGREFTDATKMSLRSDDFREIYHPYTGDPYGGFQADKTWDSVRHQTWSATGYLRMIFQGLFGMRFSDEGIRFEPSVPESLGLTSITLRGLMYRDGDLTITVTGAGTHVAQCTIDGVQQSAAFVPASMAGKHTVEITLSAPSRTPAQSPRVRVRYPMRRAHAQ